jgi:hypothetical protein
MSADEIAKVERALARTSAEIDAMSERWAREGMSCCPSCAFGPYYSSLCDKSERQAAWLVVLLRRRRGPDDERRIRFLTTEYSEATKMVRHLDALAQRKETSKANAPQAGQ